MFSNIKKYLIWVAFLTGIFLIGAVIVSHYMFSQAIHTVNDSFIQLSKITGNLQREYQQSQAKIHYLEVELEQAAYDIDRLEGKIAVLDASTNRDEKRKAHIETTIKAIKDSLPSYGNPLPECSDQPSPGELWTIAGAIVDFSKQYAVPSSLIAGIIHQESLFCNKAKSLVGARGYMQLMPETADYIALDLAAKNGRTLRVWKRRDNIEMGVAYISKMLLEFDHDLDLAIAAYNGGPAHVKRVLAGEQVLYNETKDYVVKVKRYMEDYEKRGLH